MATTKTKKKPSAEKVVDNADAVSLPHSPINIVESKIQIMKINVHAYELNKPYCCHAMSQKALMQMEQNHLRWLQRVHQAPGQA